MIKLFFIALALGLFVATAGQAAPADDAIRACIDAGRYWSPHKKKCQDSKLNRTSPVQAVPNMPEDCILKDASFILDATQGHKITYQYSDCGDKPRYDFDDATGAIYSGTKKNKRRIAQFYDYAPGSLESIIMAQARRGLAKAEEKRCAISYVPPLRGFVYLPDLDYQKELLAKEGDFAACGPYGVTSKRIQFFRILEDKVLVFFSVAEDEAFDPMSMRLDKVAPKRD